MAARGIRRPARERRGGRARRPAPRVVHGRPRHRRAPAGRVRRAPGRPPEEVALTSCTSDGIARVLGGLELAAGDEIVTAEGEHPGLLGPLRAAIASAASRSARCRSRGVAEEVGPATRLVACSHVHWATGELAPAALGGARRPRAARRRAGRRRRARRVRELGCAFYAGSGQKWLCGPVGTGMLWVDPAWQERVAPRRPDLPEPRRAERGPGLGRCSPTRAATTRRRSAPSGSPRRSRRTTCSPPRAGTRCTRARPGSPRRWRARSPTRGTRSSRAADTTLVTWRADEPAALRERAAERGVLIRDIPKRPWLRASTGAWNDEDDLQRLLDAL